MTRGRTATGWRMRLRPAAAALGLAAAGCGSPDLPREGFVEGAGAGLYYRVMGEGDPILVVHGGPGMEHSYFLPGLDVLAANHRLVFYDQRGTGRSEAAIDSVNLTFDRFVEDIEAIRRGLRLGRVTLLAHSWGGRLGISYALRFPDNLDALVLVNSVEPGARFRQATAAAQAARQPAGDAAAIAELVRSAGFRSGDTATLNAIYRIAFRSTFADTARARDLVIAFTGRTARNGGDVARLVMTPVPGLDLWPRLREIRVPTLIVHGEADVVPVAMPAALADSIPGATLALIPGAGHFPWLENPAAFVAAIGGFLTKPRDRGVR